LGGLPRDRAVGESFREKGTSIFVTINLTFKVPEKRELRCVPVFERGGGDKEGNTNQKTGESHTTLLVYPQLGRDTNAIRRTLSERKQKYKSCIPARQKRTGKQIDSSTKHFSLAL